MKCIENCDILSVLHYEVDQKFNGIPKESKEIEVGCGYIAATDFNDAQYSSLEDEPFRFHYCGKLFNEFRRSPAC